MEALLAIPEIYTSQPVLLEMSSPSSRKCETSGRVDEPIQMEGNEPSLEREKDSSLVFLELKVTSQLFAHFSAFSKSLLSEAPAPPREVLKELEETQ